MKAVLGRRRPGRRKAHDRARRVRFREGIWSGSRRVEEFLERARQAVRDDRENGEDPVAAFRNDEIDDLL